MSPRATSMHPITDTTTTPAAAHQMNDNQTSCSSSNSSLVINKVEFVNMRTSSESLFDQMFFFLHDVFHGWPTHPNHSTRRGHHLLLCLTCLQLFEFPLNFVCPMLLILNPCLSFVQPWLSSHPCPHWQAAHVVLFMGTNGHVCILPHCPLSNVLMQISHQFDLNCVGLRQTTDMTQADSCAPRQRLKNANTWRSNKGTFHSSLHLPFPVKNVEFASAGPDKRVSWQFLLSFSNVSDKCNGRNWSFMKTHVQSAGHDPWLVTVVSAAKISAVEEEGIFGPLVQAQGHTRRMAPLTSKLRIQTHILASKQPLRPARSCWTQWVLRPRPWMGPNGSERVQRSTRSNWNPFHHLVHLNVGLKTPKTLRPFK